MWISLFVYVLQLKTAGSFYVADVTFFNHKNHKEKPSTKQPFGDWYLVNPRNGECRVIPDETSRDYLIKKASLDAINITIPELLNHAHLHTGSSNNNNNRRYPIKKQKTHCHHLGSPLPSFDLPESSPDEITRRHMILFEAMQGSPDLLHISKYMKGCFNPSIAPFASEESSSNGLSHVVQLLQVVLLLCYWTLIST